MKSSDKVHGVFHVRGWFPGIVGIWVALPFDKILDSSTVLSLLRLQDCLNFVMVVFLTNNFRRGTKVVGAMSSGFFIWRQEGVVEILHVAGNCNLQLTPHVVSTLKGP